jgi:hypothetical protein
MAACRISLANARPIPLVAQERVQLVRPGLELGAERLDRERRIERLGADVGQLRGERVRP